MKECKIEIGELVELKSGSLKMTVSNLKKNSDGRIMADCVWFNKAKDFPQNFSSPYDGAYSAESGELFQLNTAWYSDSKRPSECNNILLKTSIS